MSFVGQGWVSGSVSIGPGKLGQGKYRTAIGGTPHRMRFIAPGALQ